MSEKKPLTEGYIRGITKGSSKPTQSNSVKPTQPPPAPKPQKNKDD